MLWQKNVLAWVMQGSLPQLLEYLLNTTGSLGVGYIDPNGLLIEAKGAHAGKNPHDLACHLSHYRPAQLAGFLGDHAYEQVLMGKDSHLYLRWLPNERSLMYVLTLPNAQGGPIRHALQQTVNTFYAVVQKEREAVSGVPFRERLEQPRQFHSFPLVRNAFKDMMQEA